MNSTDIKIINNMISEAWNDENAFCRKLKDYLGRHFAHEEEIAKRCADPYWKNKNEVAK